MLANPYEDVGLCLYSYTKSGHYPPLTSPPSDLPQLRVSFVVDRPVCYSHYCYSFLLLILEDSVLEDSMQLLATLDTFFSFFLLLLKF